MYRAHKSVLTVTRCIFWLLGEVRESGTTAAAASALNPSNYFDINFAVMILPRPEALHRINVKGAPHTHMIEEGDVMVRG